MRVSRTLFLMTHFDPFAWLKAAFIQISLGTDRHERRLFRNWLKSWRGWRWGRRFGQLNWRRSFGGHGLRHRGSLADDWAGVVTTVHGPPSFPSRTVTRGRTGCLGRPGLSRAGHRLRGCGNGFGILPGSPILIPDRQRDKSSRKKPAADFLNGFVHRFRSQPVKLTHPRPAIIPLLPSRSWVTRVVTCAPVGGTDSFPYRRGTRVGVCLTCDTARSARSRRCGRRARWGR